MDYKQTTLKLLSEHGGLCPGSIYIDLIHDVSAIIGDPGRLCVFTTDLWDQLYEKLKEERELYVAVDEGDAYIDTVPPTEMFDRLWKVTSSSKDDWYFDTVMEYKQVEQKYEVDLRDRQTGKSLICIYSGMDYDKAYKIMETYNSLMIEDYKPNTPADDYIDYDKKGLIADLYYTDGVENEVGLMKIKRRKQR